VVTGGSELLVLDQEGRIRRDYRYAAPNFGSPER